MSKLFHKTSGIRIFGISGTLSLIAILGVWHYMGPKAALIALALMIIEITFSFENAIINARVLVKMNPFWQRMFMTVGILIAVFGMRIVFPILVVMLSAHLSWGQVVDLALHHPTEYAEALAEAHPSIAAFGGMFLLMLCLHFFFDGTREVRWLARIEQPLQRIGRSWLHALVSLFVLVIVVALSPEHHRNDILFAGTIGIGIYALIHWLSHLMTIRHEAREKQAGKKLQAAGAAGLMSFLYLETLDASFSFDGVIGAFALTSDVVLIAVGLGVGALWVRSLTLFMVHRHVLHAYRYLEHGAHYTIGILALVLLAGLFIHLPEMIAGLSGIAIISAAIVSSVRANRDQAA